MKTCILRSHFNLPRQSSFTASLPKPPHHPLNSNTITTKRSTAATNLKTQTKPLVSRYVVLGAVTFGVAMLFGGMEEHNRALAFGPEGPLMEDFWDNMRRYGLYALTVSTGALYTIFQPIFELLKNPISAILLLVILVGSFYIVSQVVTAMVGVSDFAYEYAY